MTMERTIRTRLAAGATVRPDGRGVTLDLPGSPSGWFVQHVYDRAVAEMPGAGACSAIGPQSRRGQTETPLATPSAALADMLAGLERRA